MHLGKRNRGKEGREGGEEEEGGKVEEKKQKAPLCILWKVLQAVLDWGAAFETPTHLTGGPPRSLMSDITLSSCPPPAPADPSISLAQSLAGFTSLELGQLLNKK